ncbi:Glyoxylase, beta-lactamase superfamily II [Syntrophus gentianae]|uniref:Glyoxylase, beta-lactamase superfamily II n=1 Tax=Syntrophus gentianae TaxID=43775 RepID=A0A1H7XPF7_9BACT|nr:MBL fold metallo-hydrolase [Syntrophus gentianae]SEM35098.1 Glyoxylase, beta-lactamase superfamily II [Syntrophus gentianae]
MGSAVTIVHGVYLIGGANVTRSEDAAAYLLDFGKEQVMIDSGAGGTANRLEQNIRDLGFDPQGISTLILTHRHIDHIGAAPYFRANFGCRILMHEEDAEAVEKGDPVQTVANWYQTTFPPTPVDIRIFGKEDTLTFDGEALHLLHTPGHTPGSLSLYLDRDGRRILFGQDIHGPFFPRLGANLAAWRQSMEKLLDLKADLLCEGHFGIYQPNEAVEGYIREHLRRNKV